MKCEADDSYFFEAAVDRNTWCSEIECRTRILEFVVVDDDGGDVSSSSVESRIQTVGV